MKRFIVISVIVLLVIAAADQLVGRALRHAYSHVRYDEIGKLNYIADSARTSVIIIGSSRALHHYVPSIITDSTGLSCYNCGIEAGNIYLDYALLRTVLQRYKPHVIIYEFHYGYDAMRYDAPNPSINKVRPLWQLKCRDSLLCDIDPMERVHMLSAIYPYNSLLADIVLASNRHNSPYNNALADHGYVPQFHVIKRHHESYATYTRALSGKKLGYLKKLAAECGSRLIVATSPYYEPQPDMRAVHQPVVDLFARYHVQFIYLAQDSALVGKPIYWDDAGHLNDRGARVFTSQMIHLAKQARPQLIVQT